jgi:hypothetical protein
MLGFHILQTIKVAHDNDSNLALEHIRGGYGRQANRGSPTNNGPSNLKDITLLTATMFAVGTTSIPHIASTRLLTTTKQGILIGHLLPYKFKVGNRLWLFVWHCDVITMAGEAQCFFQLYPVEYEEDGDVLDLLIMDILHNKRLSSSAIRT